MNLNPDPNPQSGAAPHLPPRDYYRDPRLKSPVVAGLLSLMPGIGQAYLGFNRLAFIHGLTAASCITLMSSNKLGELEPLVGVFMVFFWLYNMVDAHRRALLINEAVLRMEPSKLPDGLGRLSFGGRLGFGLALVAFGTMSLLYLRFGVSFAWFATWWPVAFVVLGIYLVMKAIKDHKPEADAARN
jgi:hypothetical protein